VDDDNCTPPAHWTTAGSNTSVPVTGLNGGTQYFWQVRAIVDSYHTYADGGNWWTFTTQGEPQPTYKVFIPLMMRTGSGMPPGVFIKIDPTHNAVDIPINPDLSWSASSDAASYEYCIDSSNDGGCTHPADWINAGDVMSVTVGGMDYETPYYWQVRARNANGTTEASDGWWKFTTLPEPIQVIINGDFESGQGVGWIEYSLNGWELIMHSDDFPVTPHGGNWATWLGGDHSEISSIQQTFTVPNGTSYLHLWYWIESEDECGYDYGYVRINSSDLQTWDLCVDNSTEAWTELSLDLGAYAEQSVLLEILVETDTSLLSNLFIDDVSLSATPISRFNPTEPGFHHSKLEAITSKTEFTKGKHKNSR
jgi:hypothetical protein